MGNSSKIVFGILIIGLLAVAGSAAAENGWIAGKVTTGLFQTAVPGATVTVQNGTGTATTDANGSYNITVPEGSYTLKVTKTGYVDKTTATITVTANNTTTQNIGIDKQTGTLTGTVKDEDGKAVQYVSITPEGYIIGVMTDASGKYTIANMSLGLVNVTVTSLDYDTQNFTITIVAGTNTKDLVLKKETYVELYVTGPTVLGIPFPLEGATVTCGNATGTTNSLGYVKLVVAPGPYKLTLKAKDYKTYTKDITVTRGANTFNAQLAKTSGTSEDTGFLAGLFALGLLICLLPIIILVVIIVLVVWLIMRRKKANQAPMPPAAPPAPPQTPPPPPPA